MNFTFNTKLKGVLQLTDELHRNMVLQDDQTLFKFIIVEQGELLVEVDHVFMELKVNDLITISPLHEMRFLDVRGSYFSLVFNSNFYCIYGHDNEVSCNGFLFNSGASIMHLHLTDSQIADFRNIAKELKAESVINDPFQEEMLRLHLKRFIITATRLGKEKYDLDEHSEHTFNLIRHYFLLVDAHYKEKKQVKDYAELLHRSPKTLSHIFAAHNLPSPLQIIHERILTEAKRLLLYSSKPAKEIAYILGFDSPSVFSRFFKNTSKESISQFQKRMRAVEK
ncbi:MAG TPA: AraC family transcriptional regulator [Paludibacteraceae bacterium]|nr:AraC family transcriptional regulator [Paludibacteraceae bacterium]HQB68595.1 AraC family transcriptional regulator [Paludibacteraceae bacterium]